MKKQLRTAYTISAAFGFDGLKFVRALKGLPVYLANISRFIGQHRKAGKKFGSVTIYPCLDDRYSESGSVRGHYFHQDLLVARRIYHRKPTRHVDVGSRVDGFVAHVATFREIDVIDIRKINSKIPNIVFIQCDLMGDLPEALVGTYDSVSCLHALEHFGLGRYGDPIKYGGYMIGFNNLDKMLRHGGKMYISVPIGPQRVEYDAHRVFSLHYLLNLVSERFKIDSFSFVDDAGDLFEDVPLKARDLESIFGCSYGCGIFEMTKL